MTDDKSKPFLMDGTKHYPGKECCGSFSQPCPRCGGIGHYQPVYGGVLYECEKCHHSWS